MVKKAVLFDLDDTLYDYNYAHSKALNKVYLILAKEIKITKKKIF